MHTALVAVLALERAGPERFIDRLSGPFDKG